MWQELKELKHSIEALIFFLGDFNEVLELDERKGGISHTISIREFRDWVEELGLIDLPLVGRNLCGVE